MVAESEMLTQERLRRRIKAFSRTISDQPLRLAGYTPESWGEVSRCFENVRRKVQQDGGRIQFGWMFHHRLVLAIPGPGYLIAAHHAVWHAPDGHLFDVTPFHADPKHHPLTPGGGVLFLVDDHAAPVVSGRLTGPLPSKFFGLNDGKRLGSHVQQLRTDEEQQCRRIYEDDG
jgi:hypothetical protein